MSYPGGKAAAGTWQRIINQIPPHRWYCEPFLGAGAILQRKRPAERNFGFDLDPDVIRQWEGFELPDGAPLVVQQLDAFEWLADNAFGPGDLVYLDPPYPREVRSSGKRLYRCELLEPEQHARLLELVKAQRCMVLISSYWSQQYADALRDWRNFSLWSTTRGGMKEEWVWANYPEPLMLHDYSQLGSNYRQREKYRRRVRRLREKLLRMPPMERMALLEAWQELPSPDPASLE